MRASPNQRSEASAMFINWNYNHYNLMPMHTIVIDVNEACACPVIDGLLLLMSQVVFLAFFFLFRIRNRAAVTLRFWQYLDMNLVIGNWVTRSRILLLVR